MDLESLSAEQIIRLVRENRISCEQIAEHYSRKIERLNPVYSCFLDFSSTPQNAGTGAPVTGALAGVPISVKDLIETSFLKTSYGTSAFRQHRPNRNAAIVDSLLEAGAVIVGKTSLTECGGAGYHPEFPAPVNPANKDLWTGISSSGAAVSVAAGLCKAAIASDTGGSVRTPAACHGLVGFKPTKGALDTRGMLGFAPSLDHLGVIAANVADAATTFRAITKRKGDASSPKRAPTIGWDPASLSRLLSPALFQQFQASVVRLKEQGHIVREIAFPDVSNLGKGWLDYASYELVNNSTRDWFRFEKEIGQGLLMTLQYGREITATRYQTIAKEAGIFQSRLNAIFAEVDFIASPLLPFGIPGKDFEFDFHELDHQLQFLVPYNFTGNPAITIPNSVSGSVPFSNFQLIGRANHDDALLDFAFQLERALKPLAEAR